MRLFRRIASLAAGLLIGLIPSLPVSACTSFILMANDGSAVYGRTMEWGTFDLNSRLVVVPRGHAFSSTMVDGRQGLSWKARYGAVAIDALERDMLTDGMNEKGLVVGALYQPGFADYMAYRPQQANQSIGSADLQAYLLTQFATVDQVASGIRSVRVVPIPEEVIGGIAPPFHWIVSDRSGKTITIEYIKGQLQVHDNKLRIMTNSPTFDWHLINLRNYVNLSPVALPSKKIEDLDFRPLGGGSGFIGLPGDFTPPSRFVRLAAFTQAARPTPDAEETVYEVLRILDNFNVPLGASEGANTEAQLEGMRSSTIWTSVADTDNLVYYYHTQHDRRLRKIDLNQVDFSPRNAGLLRFPLDTVKSQDVKDVTPVN